MTAATMVHESQTEVSAPMVVHMDEVAETIRDDALAHARKKLSPFEHGLDPATLFQSPDFIGHFVYGLAIRVADALAAHDRHVQAVYTYDPAANPADDWGETAPETIVHLLVLVTAPSAALEAFISALDRALIAAVREAHVPPFAGRESILDVNLVTETDKRLGRGLASMFSAVFAPPIRIWQREH